MRLVRGGDDNKHGGSIVLGLEKLDKDFSYN